MEQRLGLGAHFGVTKVIDAIAAKGEARILACNVTWLWPTELSAFL